MSPNPQSKPDSHERQTVIALFRYGLIAPLIHEAPGQSMQEQCLREIAAKRYEIPYSTRTQVSVSALRRYLKRYRAGGFEALYPYQRSDAGQPRSGRVSWPSASTPRASYSPAPRLQLLRGRHGRPSE